MSSEQGTVSKETVRCEKRVKYFLNYRPLLTAHRPLSETQRYLDTNSYPLFRHAAR